MHLSSILILTICVGCVLAARRHQIQYPDEEERPYKRPNGSASSGAQETDLLPYELPLLDIRLLGALYKLRVEQNIDFDLIKVTKATRRPTGFANDDIYTIDAVLDPNKQRCKLIMMEQEDELYYNLDITCGRDVYHVTHGISRDDRINSRFDNEHYIKIHFVQRGW